MFDGMDLTQIGHKPADLLDNGSMILAAGETAFQPGVFGLRYTGGAASKRTDSAGHYGCTSFPLFHTSFMALFEKLSGFPIKIVIRYNGGPEQIFI